MVGTIRTPFTELALLLASMLAAACAGSATVDPVGSGGRGDPALAGGKADDGADPDTADPEGADLADAGHRPQMGINYNGQLEAIDLDAIARTRTTWVRGFIDVLRYAEAPERYETKLSAYETLRKAGYKTILNTKWNFHNRSFPAPGSPTMEAYKGHLALLLDRVWPATDLIVSGNEPFIESRPGERDERLVAFYREMTRMMIDHRRSRPRKIPICVGALQNPHAQAFRTAAARRLIAFARSNAHIAGIDLHIHHRDGAEIGTALAEVHAGIRPDQRILVTEFSLMRHWRAHLGDRIAGAFAATYGLPASMRNFEYLDRALEHPVQRQQWVDFLRASPWFESRKRYLRNAYQQMSRFSRFFVATYAARQSHPHGVDFTSTTDPWIINGIYANRTVAPRADGAPRFNYAWIDDFRAIQRGDFQ